MNAQPVTYAAPAPRQSTDTAMWGLIALLVVLVAASAGWLVARASSSSWGDVNTASAIALREGAVQGRERGFGDGAKSGRREAKLQGQYEALRNSRNSFTTGWQQGYQNGTDRALARETGLDPYLGASAYSGGGIDDLELSTNSMFADVPGYATSSLPGLDPYSAGASGSSLGGSGAGNASDMYLNSGR